MMDVYKIILEVDAQHGLENHLSAKWLCRGLQDAKHLGSRQKVAMGLATRLLCVRQADIMGVDRSGSG